TVSVLLTVRTAPGLLMSRLLTVKAASTTAVVLLPMGPLSKITSLVAVGAWWTLPVVSTQLLLLLQVLLPPPPVQKSALALSSKAPMSTWAPSIRGKPGPRWSVNGGPLKGGLVTAASVPALMGGLPGSSAMVWVGPPLFCSVPSSGSALLTMVPAKP